MSTDVFFPGQGKLYQNEQGSNAGREAAKRGILLDPKPK
jgi:hypothetical protein